MLFPSLTAADVTLEDKKAQRHKNEGWSLSETGLSSRHTPPESVSQPLGDTIMECKDLEML